MSQGLLRLQPAAALGLTLLLGAGAAAQSGEPASVIVILDGSGSMWGKLDGERTTKLVQSRDALRASLAQVPPQTRIGFASFGHRRSGDCNDVQVIVAPDAPGLDRLNQPLEKHNPRGRGPLTLAVRTAARVVAGGPGPKSVVLIHDDPDNCVPDTCAALADLPQTAPGVVVHVVGLGIRGEEAQRLQCLTKATGGRHFDAQTGAQAAAFIREAIDAAALGSPPPEPQRAPRPAPTPAPAPSAAAVQAVTPGRAPLAADGPPGMRLAVLLAPGSAPPQRPIRWTVTRAGDASRTVVLSGIGQDVIAALPEGTYVVEAVDGLLAMKTSVAVGPAGQTAADLVWTGGLVRLAGGADERSEEGYVVSLFEPPRTAQDAPRAVAMARSDGSEAFVPAGRYLMRVERGRQRTERVIEVAAGATIAVDAPRTSGTVALSAPRVYPAAENAPRVWLVFEDDPDAPRGRREVARSGATAPRFEVPAGTYTVVLRQGELEARERISVRSGETIQQTLDLAPATVTLVSTLAGLAPSNEDPITFRIERLDAQAQPMLATARSPVVALPAGRYRIEARHGLANARETREVEFAAGQTAVLRFEQRAGSLRLAGSSGGDATWELRDANGRRLWSSAEPGSRVVLAEGRYVVRAVSRARAVETAITIRAGEHREMELKE